jgi:hypothetical protein
VSYALDGRAATPREPRLGASVGLTSGLVLENASLRQTFQVDREPRPTILLPNLSSLEWAVYRKIMSHRT